MPGNLDRTRARGEKNRCSDNCVKRDFNEMIPGDQKILVKR